MLVLDAFVLLELAMRYLAERQRSLHLPPTLADETQLALLSIGADSGAQLIAATRVLFISAASIMFTS